jgi:hypothetical protein
MRKCDDGVSVTVTDLSLTVFGVDFERQTFCVYKGLIYQQAA